MKDRKYNCRITKVCSVYVSDDSALCTTKFCFGSDPFQNVSQQLIFVFKKNLLYIESDLAVDWFRQNKVIVNSGKFQAAVLKATWGHSNMILFHHKTKWH